MWKLERGWTEVEVLRSKIQRERIPLNPTCAGLREDLDFQVKQEQLFLYVTHSYIVSK